jgi:isoquinoline 1-oxidoreductase alpha subunit
VAALTVQGQTMVALLKQIPDPSDAQIDAQVTNLCRCGTYERVRRAIHSLARSQVPGQDLKARAQQVT